MYFLTLALSATAALAALVPPPSTACDLVCISEKQCVINPDNGHTGCLTRRACQHDDDCGTEDDGTPATMEQVCHLYCEPKGHIACDIAGGYCVPK